MVHERDDKYEGQEDGEYHFSDDQANYEMEPDEATQPAEPKASAAVAKTSGGIEQYKRPLIGVAVFVVLIFLVYKITAPAPSTAPGDFTQNTAAPTAAQKSITTVPPKTAQVVPATAPQNSAFQPLSQPLGMSSSSTRGVVQPTQAAPAPTVQTQTVEPAAPIVVQTVAPTVPEQPAPAVIVQQQASSAYNPAHPTSEYNNTMVSEPSEIAGLNQRISVLTQQNAKMQVDYSQKIADYEAQNTALQGKLQDLNMRLASLETTLAHLGRAIQQDTRPSSGGSARPINMPGSSPALPMMSSSEPRAAYTVQAIIPGRAWLKSEGGETVTVAEGDTLKGYGRIMKIDPYDGIVELDVGGKVIALSYGATGE
jgi:intracellular multiplication protein IcmG